jgi:hypothetical protein
MTITRQDEENMIIITTKLFPSNQKNSLSEAGTGGRCFISFKGPESRWRVYRQQGVGRKGIPTSAVAIRHDPLNPFILP